MSDEVFGLSRRYAEILHGIADKTGADQNELKAMGPRSFPIMLGKSNGTIAANSTGSVYYMEPTGTSGWSATSQTYTVCNPTSVSIPTNILGLIFAINGRWLFVPMECA